MTYPHMTFEEASEVSVNEKYALQMTNITKVFPGVKALDDVNLNVKPGEVHALVGGNGAGKSTLMAVASGVLTPDAGTISINGQVIEDFTPRTMKEHGLAIAFQNPAIVPHLTVGENLLLAVAEEYRPKIQDVPKWVEKTLEPMGMEIPHNRLAGRIPLAEKQAIEICAALASKPSVLILDEPTEPFMNEQVERLFELIRQLREQGTAVIYISHRLPDVFELADSYSVIRDGQIRGSGLITDITEDEIINLVAGRKIEALFPDKRQSTSETHFQLQDFKGEGFAPVTLDVQRNEIIGIAGVEGQGQRQFLRTLGGMSIPESGGLSIAGRPVAVSSIKAFRESGIMLMPQERTEEGLVPMHSVYENISLVNFAETSKSGFINVSKEKKVVKERIAEMSIKAATPEVAAETLSGGNQQKIVMSRALSSNPKVLLCDEPTQGIDVGVRSDIYNRLRQVADSGVPVFVLSSDNVELTGLCDRVLVFSQGRVVAELTGDDITDEEITAASLKAGSHTDAKAPAVNPSAKLKSRSKLRELLSSDQGPSMFLGIAVLLAIGVGIFSSENFLSSYNISNILLLMAPILFLAAGQQIVMMTAGIDLSVGPLTGALVVVASFYLVPGMSLGWMLVGVLLVVGLALGIGLFNGALVRFAEVSPVVTTLITYTGLQGLSLFMRDVPGGTIAPQILSVVNKKIGFIPIAFLVGALLLICLEIASRKTLAGMYLRGTGSNMEAAAKRGVPVNTVITIVYILAALLAVAAAAMLMGQIGLGDPTAGVSYTLTSITAVVLGGASVFGGRGSFVGVLLGATLLQITQNVAIFMGLSQAWQYWLVGLMALGATGIFAQWQRVRVG